MEAKRSNAPRRRTWREAIDRLWQRKSGAVAPIAAPPDGNAFAAKLDRLVGGVDFLAFVDTGLHFLYVSEASLRFVGYRDEYLRAVTLHELIAAGETAALDALIARARTSASVERATLHLMKSLTYPIPVELRVVASIHEGKPCFAISAFDISGWRTV